jgi:WD40 repeat protein
MIVRFHCPKTGRTLKAPHQKVGRLLQCPACGANHRVPAPTPNQSPGNPPFPGGSSPPLEDAADKKPSNMLLLAGVGALALLVVLTAIISFVALNAEPANPQDLSTPDQIAGTLDIAPNFPTVKKPGQEPKTPQSIGPARKPDPSSTEKASAAPPTIEITTVDPKEPQAGLNLLLQVRGKAPNGTSIDCHYRKASDGEWKPAKEGRVEISNLRAGALTLQFRSVDRNGIPSEILERSWTVKEPKPPAIEIAETIPLKPRQNGSVRIQLKSAGLGSDPVAYQYRIGPDGKWQNAAGGTVVISGLKPGELRVQFRALDRHGQPSEPLSQSWKVPEAVVTSRPASQFTGHGACVHGLAFSPDAKTILSGCCDKTLRLWDAKTTKMVRDFKGVAGQVYAVDISPDGRYAVSGGFTFTLAKPIKGGKAATGGKNLLDQPQPIQVWDLASGKELRRLAGHTNLISSLKFSPDSKLLASAGHDQTIRVWNVMTGALVKCLKGHQAAVYAVAWSPDGKRLASSGGLGTRDCTVRLWDPAAGKELLCLSGHSHAVTGVAFLFGGVQVISSSGRVYRGRQDPVDPFLRRWDLDAGKEVGSYRGSDDGTTSLTATADNKYLFCAAGDGTMRLCEPQGGGELQCYKWHEKKVLCVSISPNNHHVVTGSEDGRLLMWDLPVEVHIPLFPIESPR